MSIQLQSASPCAVRRHAVGRAADPDDPSVAGRCATDPAGVDWRLAGWWLLSALAFPPAGWLAFALAGPVDGPVAALVGGAIVGVGIGIGQWLALRPVRLGPLWVAATAAAMAAGLALGAAVTDYRTGTLDLVVMGAVTGMVLGAAQAFVLRSARVVSMCGAVLWAAAVPALWSLGWWVTASAGIDVERRYAVFGLTGALASAAAGGLLLATLVRERRR